jgi:hypothetical protein
MGSKPAGKIVVPVETNWKVQTLRDKEYGRRSFESSCYLKDDKMLVKGDSSWSEKTKLIMCVNLGKKLSKCN